MANYLVRGKKSSIFAAENEKDRRFRRIRTAALILGKAIGEEADLAAKMPPKMTLDER